MGAYPVNDDIFFIKRFLSGLLVSGRWPRDAALATRAAPDALAETARGESVAAALFESIRWEETDTPAASALRAVLIGDARRAAVNEILNRAELERVLPRLIERGHRFLLIKGAPLGYTLYPNPAQRGRCDTDVLVPPDAVAGFIETLRGLGYREQPGISGEIVSHQKSVDWVDARGCGHVFDVHWKISNRPGLADRIGFEELWANRLEVPALGAGVCAPDDVSALLLACLHLAGHHPGAEKLIWLYDIHLLAQALDSAGKARFAALCRERGIAGQCLPVLSLTSGLFPSPALAALITGLDGAKTPPKTAGRRHGRLAMLAEDLRALPDWRARLRLLKEHAFPDAAYIRERYRVRANFLLPYYYLKRLVTGVRGWLRR